MFTNRFKKGKLIRALAGCLALLLLPVRPVFAAERGDYHHDYAKDTQDYCISVYDVNLTLSEARGDAASWQALIISTAAPEFRIRNSAHAWNDWERLAYTELTFDFSAFAPVPSAEGYPIQVSAPAITLQEPSSITFLVYALHRFPVGLFQRQPSRCHAVAKRNEKSERSL